MKRGTPDHWKMRELARQMKIPDRYALPWSNGTMERLWHYVAKYHPQGDVGKSPDWAIAEACGCPKSSAKVFVDALVNAKWLDRDSRHRLIVHDWHEHADDSVKKTLKNRGLPFLFPENSGTVDGKFRPALALAFPLPLQQQPAPPETASPPPSQATTDVVVVEILEAMRERFPTVPLKLARNLFARVCDRHSNVTGIEVAEAIRCAWFPTQTSAGCYLETVPEVIETMRARARDSPQQQPQQLNGESGFEHALEVWGRASPEDREELKRIWPGIEKGLGGGQDGNTGKKKKSG